jgi:hypothetical protein
LETSIWHVGFGLEFNFFSPYFYVYPLLLPSILLSTLFYLTDKEKFLCTAKEGKPGVQESVKKWINKRVKSEKRAFCIVCART